MHLCSVSSSFANKKDVPFDILQIFQLNLLNTVQLFGSLGLLGVCFVESSCFSSGSKENKAVLLALLKPKVGPWKKKKKVLLGRVWRLAFMKQLEMKHTALILSSCSWSCCTFRKFIIRWLYPQCFPCSSLYNQQFIFLSLEKKTQQQNPQLQRKKRGRKYKQEWLEICLIASSPCKKRINQMLSFLHIPANFCWSIALFYHSSFPLCCTSFLFTVFIFPVNFFFSLASRAPSFL